MQNYLVYICIKAIYIAQIGQYAQIGQLLQLFRKYFKEINTKGF